MTREFPRANDVERISIWMRDMSANQEPLDDKNAGDADRVAELEERLAALEEALRLRDIEDRVGDLEASNDDDGSENPPPEAEGQRAMRLAIAQFLNNESTAKAVSELLTILGSTVKELSSHKTKELQSQKTVSLWSYFGGLGFSAFLLVILTALLWHDKITKELAAGLLGSLIGYWYGRDKPKG